MRDIGKSHNELIRGRTRHSLVVNISSHPGVEISPVRGDHCIWRIGAWYASGQVTAGTCKAQPAVGAHADLRIFLSIEPECESYIEVPGIGIVTIAY